MSRLGKSVWAGPEPATSPVVVARETTPPLTIPLLPPVRRQQPGVRGDLVAYARAGVRLHRVHRPPPVRAIVRAGQSVQGLLSTRKTRRTTWSQTGGWVLFSVWPSHPQPSVRPDPAKPEPMSPASRQGAIAKAGPCRSPRLTRLPRSAERELLTQRTRYRTGPSS